MNAWARLKLALARRLLAGTDHVVRRRERRDDPPPDLPPQHFNCRCMLPPGCEAFKPEPGTQTLADCAAKYHEGGFVGKPSTDAAEAALRNMFQPGAAYVPKPGPQAEFFGANTRAIADRISMRSLNLVWSQKPCPIKLYDPEKKPDPPTTGDTP